MDERDELLLRLQGLQTVPEKTSCLWCPNRLACFTTPAASFPSQASPWAVGLKTIRGHPMPLRPRPAKHIADWISSYYQHLDHASLLTLADLQHYGLNADHMNNHAEL